MTATYLYVGTCNRALPYFATANGEGIAGFRFDEASGRVTPIGVTKGTDNPTFLAIDPAGRTLYATSEVLDWNEGMVTAYSIDGESGALSYINKQPTRGSIAAMMSFDQTGRYLFAVNYGVGPMSQRPNRSLVVYPLAADGELGAPIAETTHEGKGFDPARQERPHAHCVRAAPNDRFVVVSDLGLDALVTYRFDAATGSLARQSEAKLPPGSGPRHFVFHPSRPFAYAVNELASTAASLAFDAATGQFKVLAIAPTVAPSAIAGNHCSEITIAPGGQHLFVGNRGADSVSRFAIDPATGIAALVDTFPSHGQTPRHLCFDPSGKVLAVANQDSDCIAMFAFDLASGGLRNLGEIVATGTPTCITFVRV